MSNTETQNLSDIQSFLKEAFLAYIPLLQVRKDNENVFEVSGTIEAMQGKQRVDGYYFGSVVPKPKDIRLYYFPIYTHVKKFNWISEELRKCLKGKSCFHIKKLNESLSAEIAKMIQIGIEIYKKDNLI